MITDAGISTHAAPTVLWLVGWGEVVLGLLVVVFSKKRWPFVLTIVLMILATISVVVNSPHQLSAAFNPISLNVLMMAMALVGLLCVGDLPSARRCLRKMPESRP